MAKGKIVQSTKPSASRRTVNSSNTKSSAASPAPSAKQSVNNKFSTASLLACQGCGNIVTDDMRALQCDRCTATDAWKCASCLGLSDDLYDQLLADSGPKLRWFCDSCDKLVIEDDPIKREDRLDKLMGLMENVLAKYQHLEAELDKKFDIIEGRLNDKCDTSRAQLEARLTEAEDRHMKLERDVRCEVTLNVTKVEAHMDNLERRISAVETTMQSNKPDNSKQSDDEEEKEEKEKRKNSVIIHGVSESDCESPTDRQDEDLAVLAAMLHELDCDEVKATKAIRLGKRSTDASSENKPRPIKMMVESEEQKIKVIRSAKNLRLLQDGGWKKVFIHQDLTLKEREERRRMLGQLKKRREDGETGLVLVGNKIVKRFIKKD